MMLGDLKRIERALHRVTAPRVIRALTDRHEEWLFELLTYMPRTRLELVQAFNICRHAVKADGMTFADKDLTLACLCGLIRNTRACRSDVAYAMRLLPRAYHTKSAKGIDRIALNMIGRAARPTTVSSSRPVSQVMPEITARPSSVSRPHHL